MGDVISGIDLGIFGPGYPVLGANQGTTGAPAPD